MVKSLNVICTVMRPGNGKINKARVSPPWGIEAPGFTELEAKRGGNPRPLSD